MTEHAGHTTELAPSPRGRLRTLSLLVPAVVATVLIGAGGFAMPAVAAPSVSASADIEDDALLSGTVYLGNVGHTNSNVTVQLQSAGGGLQSFVATTQNGEYAVRAPGPGDYRIIFLPNFDGIRYQTQYLGGTPDPAKAQVVKVEAGVDQTGLDITLPESDGEISTISRVSGDDRYSTAVSVSQNHWPDGDADSVWIVTGENYPDALSAGPAAVRGHGPVLLTEPDNLPDNVRAEIVRLGASRVVVVGGPKSVSDGVLTQLKAVVPDVIRISGADRYEVSRNVAEYAFRDLAKAVNPFIATGTNYSDALTAGAIAGSLHSPVILVDGAKDSLDDATADLLTELAPYRVTVAGGTNSVSEAIQDDLASIAETERVAGEDRYDTAVQLVAGYQIGVPRYAYLVTGETFPDALSAAASTGAFVQPLYLSETACVPDAVLRSMADHGVEWVIVVGGEQSLTVSVEQLKSCFVLPERP